MRRIFTLAVVALGLSAMVANAQTTLRKTWDFRQGFSNKTVNALKADQEEFGDNKYWRNYEGDATKADEQHFWNASKDAKNADGYACTHAGGNETVIPELDGLSLGMSNAKKFVITYAGAQAPNEFESEGGPALGEMIPHGKSYVWLNGKNETISFQAEVNQTIKIAVESHAVNKTKVGEARGISLSASAGSLELKSGNPVPTYYTECEWELTGDAGTVSTLTIKTTNGCHIYYIIVGEGDDPDANKTKVGYLTAGDATSEPLYQAINEAGTNVITTLDAASFTAEQLANVDVTVVSPALPADNAAVSTLKEVLPFNPVLVTNAALYAAWGYGEPATADGSLGIVCNQKSELISGISEEEMFEEDGITYVMLTNENPYTGVKLGDYFAGDDIVLCDQADSAVVATHIHNNYHNALVFIPIASDASNAAKTMAVNAIDLLKSSKSAVEKVASPKINLQYKHQNTNIILAMASSNLPKPSIYYTLDGTEPTQASNLYTDTLNVTAPCTVKAVAIAEGYLLSDVAEKAVEIFSQPATPTVEVQFDDAVSTVTLACETEGVDIWYNFTEATDTTKSMKYTEPFTLTAPTTVTAFSVAGGMVFSELANKRVTVKNPKVRIDQIGLFDANAKDWQNGGGSTVYYFSWGKNAASIYDTTQEGQTQIDPETGDETTIYPEKEYEIYIPVDSTSVEGQKIYGDWQVMSKGQVMIWQSLTAGADPGNDGGYNPETAGDILSYAKIINNDIQFGGKTSGERCTGAIQSRVKFQAPFDVVTHVGTAAGGENVGKMLVEVSADSLNWTVVGDTMTTSTVKRLWKSYTRSYEGTDEVYVRVTQAGGGSSVQIYDIYILNEGEASTALKEEYQKEYEESLGIEEVKAQAMPAGIYSLNGMRLQQLRRGFNIVRSADGTTRKMMLK